MSECIIETTNCNRVSEREEVELIYVHKRVARLGTKKTNERGKNSH